MKSEHERRADMYKRHQQQMYIMYDLMSNGAGMGNIRGNDSTLERQKMVHLFELRRTILPTRLHPDALAELMVLQASSCFALVDGPELPAYESPKTSEPWQL